MSEKDHNSKRLMRVTILSNLDANPFLNTNMSSNNHNHQRRTRNPEDLQQVITRRNATIRRLRREQDREKDEARRQRAQGQEKDLRIENLEKDLSNAKRELLNYKVHVIKLNNENSKLTGVLDRLQKIIRQGYINNPNEERDIKPRLCRGWEDGEILEIDLEEQNRLCEVLIIPPVIINQYSSEGLCGLFRESHHQWISEFLKYPASESGSECYKVFIRFYRGQDAALMEDTPLINLSELNQPYESILDIPSLSAILQQPLSKVQILIHAWEMVRIDGEILKFFFNFCDHVTHFSVGQSRRERQIQREKSEIFHVMSDIFSNLEYFAMTDQNRVEWNGIWDHENVTWFPTPIKRLKTVKLLGKVGENMSEKFLLKLFWMAPELQEIHGVPSRFIQHVPCLNQNQNCRVPNVMMEAGKSATLQIFNKRGNLSGNANSRPMEVDLEWELEEGEELDAQLFLQDQDGDGADKFMQMLQKHQNTLKKLRIVPGLLLLSTLKFSIQFPTLKKLETLQLQFITDFNSLPGFNSLPRASESPRTCFFPSYLNPRKIFPRLRNVEIFYGDGDAENMSQHGAASSPVSPLHVLQQDQVFPSSVSSLKLVTDNFISREFLTHLFPQKSQKENIQQITLNSTPLILNSILPTAFGLWYKMEQLTLEIQMKEDQIVNLDNAFMGMLEETGQSYPRTNLLPVYTPVYRMRHLKLLEIIINGEIPIIQIFSNSTALAFQRMSHCHIVIKFSDLCSPAFIKSFVSTLEPIRPFVTIEDST